MALSQRVGVQVLINNNIEDISPDFSVDANKSTELGVNLWNDLGWSPFMKFLTSCSLAR